METVEKPKVEKQKIEKPLSLVRAKEAYETALGGLKTAIGLVQSTRKTFKEENDRYRESIKKPK